MVSPSLIVAIVLLIGSSSFAYSENRELMSVDEVRMEQHSMYTITLGVTGSLLLEVMYPGHGPSSWKQGDRRSGAIDEKDAVKLFTALREFQGMKSRYYQDDGGHSDITEFHFFAAGKEIMKVVANESAENEWPAPLTGVHSSLRNQAAKLWGELPKVFHR